MPSITVDVEIGEVFDSLSKAEKSQFVAELVDDGWFDSSWSPSPDEVLDEGAEWLKWQRTLGFDPTPDELLAHLRAS